MKRLIKVVMPLVGKSGMIKYFFLGILSGLSGFLFIRAVNSVVMLVQAGGYTVISRELIIMFIAIILLFVWTRKTLSLTVIRLSQTLFWTLRKQILALVLNANYKQLSEKRSQIYAAIVTDVGMLTSASLNIIDFFTSSILAITVLVYLANMSLVLFGFTLVITVIGILVYHYGSKKNNKRFEGARNLEEGFIKNFNAILNGFKEIHMEPKKGKHIYDNKIMTIAQDSYSNNASAFSGFLANQITGQVLFYVLISTILLVFSITLGITPGDTISFVFTLMYLLGSIETVMSLLPTLMRAGISANKLMDLKSELEKAELRYPMPDRYMTREEFRGISISGLEFNYGNTLTEAEKEMAFSVGPVDIDINKGDAIFIYGGNGSGKTTFVQTLIGLYEPTSGEIRLNDTVISETTYPMYKTIFSVVFSDFYLFEEMVGIDNFDMDKCTRYLEMFELDEKVGVENKAFTTTNLSTGQRKRLALIAALMESKPVLVLDEWAADQDPYFRKKFYTEIIPMLKEEGTTIIAITHDDKYYHYADRLYKMDYGKLIEENVNTHQTIVAV
jgi:putative pyoverdin transport system ATP-binding/permease protein